MEENYTIESFPDELATYILSFLPPSELYQLCQACVRFHDLIIDDENLWRSSINRNCKLVQVVDRLPKTSRQMLGLAKGFDTIGEAVTAANENDFVLLLPGIYHEGVSLTKSVNIVGWDTDRSKTVITTGTSGVVTSMAPAGSLRNVTLRQEFVKGGRPMQHFCVDVTGGAIVISECDISSNGRSCIGVRQKGAMPIIKNNVIHDSLAAGICVFEYSSPEIIDNEIFNSKYSGIEITMGANPTIKNNKIHTNVGSGIYVHNGGIGTISENDIYNNESSGVSIKSLGTPLVEKNTIRDGKRTGICVHQDGNGIIKENKIFHNAYSGIESLSPDVILENNEEYDNKIVPEDIKQTLARGECTFALTGTQHKVQDWYHCVTCGLIGNDGCCVSCANTCHKGHDVQYYKFGLFFCDCGHRLSSCKTVRK